jgi:hypothetical protein
VLRRWPAVLVFLVVFLCYPYGKWRRDRGAPVKARQAVWTMVLVMAIMFPALVLPATLVSTAMTPSERLEFVLASVAIGSLPLAVGLCFAGALELVRLYIVHARSTIQGEPR